jgi:predicted dehydrogenase
MSKATLRGAVIGYGFISSGGHVPAYLERQKKKGDVEIVAIADISEARRQKAHEMMPGVRVYASAEELLKKESGNLDFIDVSTPPVDHARIAKAGLQHGLHVICEKPLTPTVEEAKDLLETASRAHRVLFPCHNYKHAPVVKAIRSIIDSDRIGKIRSIAMTTFRNTHAKGVSEWYTDWRRDKRVSGGGIAMDHGSHTFYLAFDWMGCLPTAVTAKMSTLDSRWDTEDNFSCVLTFPNGLVNAHLTWTAGVRKVMYALQGERGAITVSDDDLELALMHAQSNGHGVNGYTFEFERSSIASHWMDASHVTWFDSLFDEFQHAIATHDFVSKNAYEAFRCIDLINAAYRSAQDHCREVPLTTLEHVHFARANGRPHVAAAADQRITNG